MRKRLNPTAATERAQISAERRVPAAQIECTCTSPITRALENLDKLIARSGDKALMSNQVFTLSFKSIGNSPTGGLNYQPASSKQKRKREEMEDIGEMVQKMSIKEKQARLGP